MRRLSFLSVIIAVLLALLCYVIFERVAGGNAGKTKAPYQLLVTTEAVAEQPLRDMIEALGTTAANEAVQISATVTAKVQAVHFEDGAQVERGSVLVELDAAAQRADVEEQRVNLAEDERQLRHLQTLIERKAVSQTDVDKQQSVVNAARAKLEASQAKLQDYSIRAPFAGTLGARRVSVGALVSPGTQIATLDDISRIKVDFSVPEVFLPLLHEGLVVQAKAPAYPDRVFEGSVAFVDTRIDPATRSINLRAYLPNEATLLRPGMLLQIVMQQPERKALLVPERSVAPLRGEQFVFVLDAPDAEGKIIARKRTVQLGSRTAGRVEIVSGIAAGETLVVDGSMSLQDGMAVTVKGPAASERKE